MVRFKKQDGSFQEVHPNKVEAFKKAFPNAVQEVSEEEVKTTTVAPGATAVEVEASSGESNLDPGSLDLSKMNLPKPLNDKIEPNTPAQIKIEK